MKIAGLTTTDYMLLMSIMGATVHGYYHYYHHLNVLLSAWGQFKAVIGPLQLICCLSWHHREGYQLFKNFQTIKRWKM